MRYSATCRRCDLQVSTENQPALDEVMDALEGADCRDERGHELRQVLPPTGGTAGRGYLDGA